MSPLQMILETLCLLAILGTAIALAVITHGAASLACLSTMVRSYYKHSPHKTGR